LFEFYPDTEAIGCAETLERIRLERARDPVGQTANHSVGGWQTRAFRLGADWLGETMWYRLERSGVKSSLGTCWGTILPPGAEYTKHRHGIGRNLIAVWCLTNNSGALHIEPDVVVPDRAGQLVVFPQSLWHWVPSVDVERVTIAANL
jgi:hypothetical protein